MEEVGKGMGEGRGLQKGEGKKVGHREVAEGRMIFASFTYEGKS